MSKILKLCKKKLLLFKKKFVQNFGINDRESTHQNFRYAKDK